MEPLQITSNLPSILKNFNAVEISGPTQINHKNPLLYLFSNLYYTLVKMKYNKKLGNFLPVYNKVIGNFICLETKI